MASIPGSTLDPDVASGRPADSATPLSYAQERAVRLRDIFPDRRPAHFFRVLELTGDLDWPAFSTAFATIVARHHVLRSRHVGSAECTQQTFDAQPVPRLVDLSDQDLDSARRTALSMASAAVAAPFDRRAPDGPCRVVLVRLRSDSHVLVLVVDQAIMDAASFAVFWLDLANSYAGRPLSTDPPDFRDHVRAERSADFWPAGAEPVLHQPTELPYDLPAPALRSGARSLRRFDVDDELVDLARGFEGGPGLVGLTALTVLLGRFCHAENVVIGAVIAHSPLPVGALHEPLPAAIDLTGAPSFEQLAARCERAVPTRRPPLAALIERLDPPRDLSRPPLFQISYAAHELGAPDFPGCVVESVDVPGGALWMDIAITAVDDGGRWRWTIEYSTDLYADTTIDRLVDELQRVLADCLAQPGTAVHLLARPPQPPAPDPLPSCPALVAAFQRAAGREPDACAVALGDERISYAALDRWSDEIGRWLSGRGVGIEVPVGVVARRLPATVALVLGILKAGGAFVPLAPDADEAYVDLVVDPADLGPPAGDRPAMRPADLGADHLLAYYRTSGSTGRPKVIATTHRGVLHYRDYLSDVIGLSAADRVLQVAPLTFDASLRDLLCPLGVGAAVRLLSDEHSRDPAEIAAVIRDNGVTAILAIVPSLLTAVVDAAPAPSLRVILVSGEVLDAELARRVRRWAPHARLVNQFGLTECTMTSTYHEVGDADVERGVIPIGRTIPSAHGYVLDAYGEPVPLGALGELYLAGPGLNRGYTSPALTAAAYVPSPFGPPGARLFRTRDLVRRSPDGVLLHHGRTDSQVKVRGVRVELDACEAALRRCAGVAAAAVTVRDGRLVAYVVGSADGSELRRQLALDLPSAMVPNQYVRLPELPTTTTGKVDRRALPDPRTARERVAARDVAELHLRACWQDVLDRDEIGVRDDFFALGGNSLRVGQLVRHVERTLGVPLDMAQVFATPTIEDLSAARPHLARPGLVRLRRGRQDRGPVVILPDLTGRAARYRLLADQFDAPVYAVEAPTDRPLATIADMAEFGADAVRSVASPVTLVGWGLGARVAVAVAALSDRVVTVVAVHAGAEREAHGSPVERYASACRLPPLGALHGDAAVAAVLRHHKRLGQLPATATAETMRRLLAVFTAAEAAQSHPAPPSEITADLVHIAAAGARPCAEVTSTGRTRCLVASTDCAAVPGDELSVVGALIAREVGAAC